MRLTLIALTCSYIYIYMYNNKITTHKVKIKCVYMHIVEKYCV